MLGVRMCPFPRARMVSKRCWSVQKSRMLGRGAADCAVAAAERVVWRKLRRFMGGSDSLSGQATDVDQSLDYAKRLYGPRSFHGLPGNSPTRWRIVRYY